MSPEERKRIADQKIRQHERALAKIARFVQEEGEMWRFDPVTERQCRVAVETLMRTNKRNQVLTHPHPIIRELAQEAWIKIRSEKKKD